jgi:hypothetical protein
MKGAIFSGNVSESSSFCLFINYGKGWSFRLRGRRVMQGRDLLTDA